MKNKERQNKLKANIWKLYVMGFIRMFVIIIPILVIFFQENGLNLAQVMILQSAFALIIVIMEIPSGFFSDVLGRKLSIIIGVSFSFVGFLVYSLSYGFWGFLLAEIIVGIGSSFISGTDSAILYDTLLELKREAQFKLIEGKVMMYRSIAEATAAIIGGLIALSSLRLTFYIQTAILFFCIPIAFTLFEPEHKRYLHKRGHLYGMYKILRFALYKNKEVKWLILLTSVVSNGTLIALWFYQPYFKLVGLPLAYFGIVWASFNFAIAIFAKYAHNIETFLGKKKSLISLILLLTVGYLIMGNLVVLPSILSVFIFALVRGLSEPVIRDYINQVTWSDKRATVMSIRNLVTRLVFVIFSPFIGWFADVYTLPAALSLCAAFVFVFGGPSLLFLHKHEVI